MDDPDPVADGQPINPSAIGSSATTVVVADSGSSQLAYTGGTSPAATNEPFYVRRLEDAPV